MENKVKKRRSRRKKGEIRVEIPQFITHVPTSKTKFMKINGQRLYSGLNPHIRAKIVTEMHNYVRPFINAEMKKRGSDLSLLSPLRIRLEFHAPINYGNVRRIKGTIRWKEPEADYVPSWDVDNMWIWGKTFNDTLAEEGHIVDDSVSFVRASGEVKWVPVDTFDERKLVFIITKCE